MNNGMDNMNNMNNGFNNQNNMNNMNNGFNNQNNMNNMNNGFNNQNNMNNGLNNYNNMPNNNYNQMGYNNMPYQKGNNKGLIYGIIGLIAVIIIGVLVYFVFLGGGNKEVLKCTQSSNGDTTEIELVFKDKKYDSGTFTETLDGSLFSESDIETLKNSDLCAEIEKNNNSLYSFKNCRQSVSKKEVSITANFVINDATEKKELNIESGKEMFESDGFTCTIK